MKKILVAFALLLSFGSVRELYATHFRGAIISWSNEPAAGTRGVAFSIRFTTRRSGYSGTAPDFSPAVGDSVTESIGATTFNFGDGTPSTGTLTIRVVAIDTINDVMTGFLEEAMTTTPSEIRHSYASGGPFTAFFSSCCRISSDRLNPDGSYRVEVTVTPESVNRCPDVNFISNVDVVQGTTLNFRIPASDKDGNTLSYRLATQAESSLVNAIPGLTIDSSSGVVTWTIPPTQAAGPYSVQFIVDDGLLKVAVDLTITVQASGANRPPSFTTPPSPCGQTLIGNVGTSLSLTLQASDPDTANTVTLNNNGLPAGATFTSTPANPATGTFSWTPTANQAGSTNIINFTATDGSQSASPCAVTINVCPPNATIAAPTCVVPGSNNNFAAVTDAGTGASYNWSITNGTINTGQSSRLITFSPGTPGTPTSLTVTVSAGTQCSASSTKTVRIDTVPDATITAPGAVCPNAAGLTASVPDSGANATYSWSIINGTLTSANNVRSVTFNTAGAASPVILRVTVVNGVACDATSTKEVVVIGTNTIPITSPTSVPPGSTGNTASVPDLGTGATYTWTVTNGTLTGGQGTRAVTFTASATSAVTLNIAGATSTCSGSGTRTIALGPAVTSLNPGCGPLAAGTVVTITGAGFISGATVKFGSASATNVTFVNATTIQATTPAGIDGLFPVTVTNPDGTSGVLAAAFDYSSQFPLRGDANGDCRVTVGDIFYLITNLFVNGPAPIRPSDVNSDNQISVGDIFFLINYLFAGGQAPPNI